MRCRPVKSGPVLIYPAVTPKYMSGIFSVSTRYSEPLGWQASRDNYLIGMVHEAEVVAAKPNGSVCVFGMDLSIKSETAEVIG
jgi:hypothetical protein